MPKLLALGILLAALLALYFLLESIRFRRFWDRACTGRSWKTRFPEVPNSEIREFLSLFVGAFGFSRSRQLSFTPDDRVMEIYRTRYPGSAVADSLELETLVEEVREQYGIDLLPSWHDDVTLGEIFGRVSRRVA